MKEREFYERMYVDVTNPPNQVGTVAKIKRKLEWYREDAAYEMLESGEHFLDLGCGEGALVLKAAQKYDYVFGVDIARPRINRAKRAAIENGLDNRASFALVHLDNALPFENGYLDAITCIAVLEHVFDPYHLVREVNRMLRPGGIFIVEVPNIAYIRRRLSLLIGRLPLTSTEEGWDGGHLHYFTMTALCDLLEGEGLRPLVKSGTGTLARLRNWWPSLLTGDLLVKATKTREDVTLAPGAG